MEENKDFQNSEENKLNEQTDFDELIKSIPDYTPENQEPIPVEEKPTFEGYKTNSLLFHFLAVFGVVFLSIFFMFNVYYLSKYYQKYKFFEGAKQYLYETLKN